MRLGSVAILLVSLLSLVCLPAASAQAPPVPDPGEAVSLACDTLGGPAPQARDLLPLCPRADPAAPAPAQEEQHVHDPAPVPAAPEDVPQLADEVLDDVRQIPEDPAEAPERLQAIVATIVQFVRDLLGVPLKLVEGAGRGIEAVTGALSAATGAVGDAGRDASEGVKRAADAVKDAAVATRDAVADAGARVMALLGSLKPDAPSRAPIDAPAGVPDAGRAADGLLELARGQVGQVLAEG